MKDLKAAANPVMTMLIYNGTHIIGYHGYFIEHFDSFQKRPNLKVLSTNPPPPIGGDLFEKEHKRKLIYF